VSSQSPSHVTSNDQSVSKSWFRGPSGSHDRILISVDIYCFIDVGFKALGGGTQDTQTLRKYNKPIFIFQNKESRLQMDLKEIGLKSVDSTQLS
jgi:hypothetical protein